MTSVLESTPPRFTAREAAAIAAELFGLEGVATDLGSERDQTFLVVGRRRGRDQDLQLGEDPATLELEAAAIAHVLRVDPGLPVAPAPAWAAFKGPDGPHFVRLFERLHGRHGGPNRTTPCRDFGATHARLKLALRGFFHPAAGRELLWDLAHAAMLRPLVAAIADVGRRRIVEACSTGTTNGSSRAGRAARPGRPRRLQPRQRAARRPRPHLRDRRLRRHFHTALVADLAVAVASLMRGRPRDDVFRARIAVDGYASRSRSSRRSSPCSATSSRLASR